MALQTGISTPFIFIKLMAEQLGISDHLSTLLISLMGVSNTVGRLIVGAIVYSCPVNPLLLLAGGCIVGGALTALSVFYVEFALLAIYSLIFGVVYGKFWN